jgi:hypothetical protein
MTCVESPLTGSLVVILMRDISYKKVRNVSFEVITGC